MAAKKTTSTSKTIKPAAASKAAKVEKKTEVRNSPVPRKTATAAPKAAKAVAAVAAASAPVAREVTYEMIARRAYEIYASGQGGNEFDNWCRAERELRAGL